MDRAASILVLFLLLFAVPAASASSIVPERDAAAWCDAARRVESERIDGLSGVPFSVPVSTYVVSAIVSPRWRGPRFVTFDEIDALLSPRQRPDGLLDSFETAPPTSLR